MMKKILFIAPSLTPGGMERMLVTIANRLVAHGYDVTVLILDDITDLRDELDERVSFRRKPYKTHFGQKLPYIRHKLYDDGMWETRATPRQLYQYYVGDEKFDVEIAFFRGMCVKIVSGSTNKDAVHLAWVHSDFRKARGYQNCFRDMSEVYDAYCRFDHVVCVSKEAHIGFQETIGDTRNTTVIYNMLPTGDILRKANEPASLTFRKAALHLVIVGRLDDKTKGQLRLIDAVTRLHNEGNDISLAVVGGGDDHQLIKSRIDEQNASSYVFMTGMQKNPYPYIKDADLLVCSSYYEGYNLTVAEALIIGTPVLSTDCTGPREILDGGNYGMIVDNSGEGLYEGLKKLCDTPGLLESYREKASQRSDFFDEDKTFVLITGLFDDTKNH